MMKKNWDAKSYSKNSRLQYLASKKFFAELELRGDEIILDIGCGTGLLTSEIAARIPKGKMVAIDSSSDMIDYAKNHFSRANIEYILMKAEDLNFPFHFDVIISSFCVHWVKHKNKLFSKIAAHLKKDGITKIIMPFRHEGIAKIRYYLMKNTQWSKYFSSIDAEELLIFDNDYKSYANESNLDNVRFQTEEVVTTFENANELKEFLKNVISHLERLPNSKLQDEFMNEIVSCYLEKSPPAQNGKCAITYTYGKITTQGIIH